MGCDTHGKIRGFVSPEDIFNFIRQKYDKNAKNYVSRHIYAKKLEEIDWEYAINEHSDNNNQWYSLHGFINFRYNNEDRSLFYHYDNINHFDNLEYYSKYNLEEMVRTETTGLSLGYWGSSVEIMRELVAQFGDGWVDDNDCDDKEYYPIRTNPDKSIKPIIYVTMEDIYEKYDGATVVIKD